MEVPPYISLLREPVAIWIANVDAANIPEVVRCAGILPSNDAQQLTVFMPAVWSQRFIQNLEQADHLSVLATSVPTYESYQYKGKFLHMRACTEDEVALQKAYVEAFSSEVEKIGLSKQAFYTSYDHQPSWALTLEVTEVFNQTPFKGTGGQLLNRASNHE